MNARAYAAAPATDGFAHRPWERLAAPALRAAAGTWYAIAVLGQLMFAVYLVGFYGRTALQGRPQAWNTVLQAGYVAGDTLGNLVLVSHLLFAVAVTLGGLVQLLPWIRRHAPAVHRWNGRVYVVSAMIAALGGLVMVWTRNTAGDLSQHVAISANAFLIFGAAILAWRHARARRYDAHRPWALRLFLCASGGWFFRIGLMLWLVVNQGPVGFDPKTFTGPFITFLSFAQYLVPLIVLEVYLRVQRSGRPLAQLAVAAGLGVLALGMAAGIAAATAMLWLPHI